MLMLEQRVPMLMLELDVQSPSSAYWSVSNCQPPRQFWQPSHFQNSADRSFIALAAVAPEEEH